MAKLLLATFFLALAASPARAQDPLLYVNDGTEVRGISFRFLDTHSFDKDQLLLQIATSEPTFWDRMKGILPLFSPSDHPFNPIELQKDVVRLRHYYRRNGFLHTRVDYPASQLDTTSNTIHVIFNVEEGPPLIIVDMGFLTPSGSYLATTLQDPLRSQWQAFRDGIILKAGTRYTEFERVRINDEVSSWLKNKGFAFARVQGNAVIDSTANTVDMRFSVDPGPRGTVDEIQVTGNESVSKTVVMRELPFKVGDRFDGRKVSDGQRQLFGLNLFRVVVAEVPDQPRDSTVTVRYRLREAKLRSVTAETGYGNDAGATAQANWRHRNFLGGARQLTLTGIAFTGIGAVTAGNLGVTRRFNLSATLQQPYLFTTQLSAIVEPFYSWEDNPTDRVKFQETGLNTTLLYELHAFRTVSVRYTFSRAFPLGGTSLTSGSISQGTSSSPTIYNRSIISTSATLGKTNDILRPTRGFLVRPFAEVAGSFLASGVEYYKLSSEVVGYYPLGRRTGLSGRLFLGRVWPFGQSSDQEDPNVEYRFDPIRFKAGGANDVRGYPEDQLGPKRIIARPITETDPATGEQVVSHDADGNVRYDSSYEPEGGLAKVAANVELRLPFPGLGPKWRSALFVDAGQVFDPQPTRTPIKRLPEDAIDPETQVLILEPAANPFTVSNLRFTAGAGVRYETIVGFIRLDVGYKLNPSTTDLNPASEVRKLRMGLDTPLTNSFRNRFRIHLSIGQAF